MIYFQIFTTFGYKNLKNSDSLASGWAHSFAGLNASRHIHVQANVRCFSLKG